MDEYNSATQHRDIFEEALKNKNDNLTKEITYSIYHTKKDKIINLVVNNIKGIKDKIENEKTRLKNVLKSKIKDMIGLEIDVSGKLSGSDMAARTVIAGYNREIDKFEKIYDIDKDAKWDNITLDKMKTKFEDTIKGILNTEALLDMSIKSLSDDNKNGLIEALIGRENDSKFFESGKDTWKPLKDIIGDGDTTEFIKTYSVPLFESNGDEVTKFFSGVKYPLIMSIAGGMCKQELTDYLYLNDDKASKMVEYFDENTLWVCVPEDVKNNMMKGGNVKEIKIATNDNIKKLYDLITTRQIDTNVNSILNENGKNMLSRQFPDKINKTKSYELSKFVITKKDDTEEEYKSGKISDFLLQITVENIKEIKMRFTESTMARINRTKARRKSGLLTYMKNIFTTKDVEKSVTESKKVWMQVEGTDRDALLEEYWELWRVNFNELLPTQSQYDDDDFEKFKKQRLTEPEYIEILNKTPGVELEEDKINDAAKMFSYHFTAVDIFKKTAATYNNDMSSRSHLFYEIKLESVVGSISNNDSSKYHTIIICDLAGKEDVISAEKMKAYITDIWNKAEQEEEKLKKIKN